MFQKIQNVYKVAEQLTQNLSLGSLGSDFWSNSLFNMSICENHVLSFCVEQHSEYVLSIVITTLNNDNLGCSLVIKPLGRRIWTLSRLQ